MELENGDLSFFELEIINVLIKGVVWHICHEDIFSVTPRTVLPGPRLIELK